MGTILQGARQAVENCVHITPDDHVVIITDQQTMNIATVIKNVVEEYSSRVKMFIMEELGKRPLEFPQVIRDELSKASASFYIGQSVKGELGMFRQPLFDVVAAHQIRHAHMIGINETIMKEGMCADYKEVQKVTQKVYDIVKVCQKIRVTTPSGTDVTGTFDSKYKWAVCDGYIRKEKWSNLPDGEVFTAPKDLNGKIVIDGCLGDFFDKYGILDSTPLYMEIKNGRIVENSVVCKNKEIEKEYSELVFNSGENSNRIGEFAIGTNIFLTHLIGNLLQDEKYPGVHVAAGSPIPHSTGADWDSKIHVDGVMKNTTIQVDDKLIMKDGKFTIL